MPSRILPVPDEIRRSYNNKSGNFKAKYQFNELLVGLCFIIPANETTLTKMRNLCNYYNKKKDGKIFRCNYDTISGTEDIVVWREK